MEPFEDESTNAGGADMTVNPPKTGTLNQIHPSADIHPDVVIGSYNIIRPEVQIGKGTRIRSYVELREGTIIGSNCYIDSGVKSSGKCRIGDNVTLRYDSIIARGTVIEDDVFIAPQLMTENLDHRGDQIGGAHIGEGVFIGTNVTLASGIRICPGTVIGSKANVRKDITEPGVYVGNPARRIK